MKYRNVGKAGIKVSEIALGSWMTDLKGSSEEDVAKEVVKLAYENGINFFDCADAYSGGAAERFFGEVLKEFPRKDLVISSKVYFPTGDGVNDRGLSRKHIMENCEQSLKNMNLDYLDLYYCHRYDENTDLEETLRAMSDLVAQGKVLYYGVSEEWGSARIEEAQKIIDYLEDGGKAIIFSNYTVEDMPNFDSILANYGVEREKGIILEGDSDKYMSYQYCLVPDISYSAITENVYGNGSVLAPMSQGILTSDSHRDSITYQPLLTTSDASYSKEDVENMTTSEKEKGDKSGPFTIGMLIQEDTNNDDEADTEIVYYSTGYLLESNYNQAVSGSNAQLLGGTVNYLCNGEKTSAAVQTKSLQVKYLTLTDRAANIWTAICVFTLPLLFIIAGLAVWASRRKR